VKAKLFVAGVLGSVVAGNAAFAQQAGPHIEPGPVVELSPDAVAVSRILLDRQVSTCVAELQRSVYQIAFTEVTRQNLRPGEAVYTFSGIALEGGDIAVGDAVMTVTEREQPGVFGNVVRVYACEVSLPSVD
jgi:hypothetical protein